MRQEAESAQSRAIVIHCNKRHLPSRLVAAGIMLFVLGGCSQVPSALNPAEWYRSTVDIISGPKEPEQAAARPESESVPGADKPFPSLASVPDRPAPSPPDDRSRIAQGLVADRAQGRRYADSVAAAPSEPVNPIRRDAPAQPAVQAIPPAATPAPLPPQLAPPSTNQAAQAPIAPPPTMAPAPPPAPASAPGSTTAGAARTDQTIVPRTPAVPQTPSRAGAAVTAEQVFRERLNQTRVEPVSGPLAGSGQQMAVQPPQMETVVISSGGLSFGTPSSAPAAAPSVPPASLPPQTAAVAGAPAGPQPAGAIPVATIYFANGSSELDSDEHLIVRQVAALADREPARIKVIGHASSRTRTMNPVEHAAANRKMSAERALEVRRQLIAAGVPGNRIEIEAVSDSQPEFYEIMPTGEAGNRRVEIFFVR